MNRWIRKAPSAFAHFFIASFVALALTFATFPLQTQAQTMQRQFPPAALRGTLVVTQPPEVLLDRNPARLSPGSRIRGANNLLVLSATLIGQEFTVNYVRNQQGEVHEVWILTAEEAAQRRPNMREGFGTLSDANRPPDLTNVPFDQLPRYGAPPPAAPAPTPNQ